VPRSTRYRLLLTRLTELRHHLLPAQFDPTASHSPRQIDRILAYRLLAHAEIEHCLEQLVQTTVTAAWSGYKIDRKPRTCLTALIAYYEGQLGGPPGTLASKKSSKIIVDLDDRIDKARHHHIESVIRQNNGMTEKNVLRLLMPVGIRASELDPSWLTDAGAFSADRGTAAHQTGRVQQIPDPGSEFNRVRRIAEGLRAIDARLTVLRDR
jgi:hypothetical protein